jgi:hypothetical protein
MKNRSIRWPSMKKRRVLTIQVRPKEKSNPTRRRNRLSVQPVRNLLSSHLLWLARLEIMLNTDKNTNGQRVGILIEVVDLEDVASSEVTTTEIREEEDIRGPIEVVRSGKIALDLMQEVRDTTLIHTHSLRKEVLLLEMTRILTTTSA